MSVVDAVRELVAPILDDNGLELVDVEANRGLVRIYIDKPGGIDLEVITEATESISRALDDHDPVPGSYTLEVSSPGLERPLKTPEHFQRFVGSDVSVRTRATAGSSADGTGTESKGERRVKGLLALADETGIAIETDDGVTERLAYGDIDRARTVFDWGPAPKPGKAPKKPKKKRTPTP